MSVCQANQRSVCFLVGSVAISGGTNVIFEHASYLADAGYEVTIAIQERFTDDSIAWHPKAKVLRCVSLNEARDKVFDLVIATWWKTALELASFRARHYAYFVQSIESRFYPAVERPLRKLVDSTYDMPITFITEATWIRHYLEEKHGQKATLVRNGIRKELYGVNGPAVQTKNSHAIRVLVEGHFGVPFKNTALAIRLTREAGVRDIWVLTGTQADSLPGVARVFSKVSMRETAAIYRSCDVLVKLSTVEGMFGPPLEMFHCGGTAIVFNVTGHDEYIVNRKNALVVQAGDLDGVVHAIRALRRDSALLCTLKAGAVESASQWPSWDQSSAEFRMWVDACLEQRDSVTADLNDLIRSFWSEYVLAEEHRLKLNPGIQRGYKLNSLRSSLPDTMKRRIDRILLLKELLWGDRRAH